MSSPVMHAISVVIPCHNPRQDYLGRVLEGLKAQALPREEWDLVVVDNASSPPLENRVDVSWHPQGRVIREETPGLTPARLRGFRESHGKCVVMVDDDNVLAPDYLEQVVRICTEHRYLGAFGGSIEPEFEVTPPEWTRPHWKSIAIRPARRSVWSNDIDHWESTPSGAGMCVRREVAEQYARDIATNPLRSALDRTGDSLASGGDTDLAWTACAMGLGMGRFKELRLTHLIPPGRLTEEYLCRMYEGKGYSGVVLNSLWHRRDPVAEYEGFANLLRLGFRRVLADWRGRQFLAAKRRGEVCAKLRLREANSCISTKGPDDR